MAASESALRVTVGVRDIPGALALSQASGWNQTADDWAVFIERGQVLGVRGDDGTLVATGAALPYGEDQGWISMVLVTPAWRKQGLATGLLDECAAHLRAAGRTPVLDATPAGEPVYRRMGFAPGMPFERWEADLPPAASAPLEGPVSAPAAGLRSAPAAGPAGADLQAMRPATASDLDCLCALDASASRIERRFLIESFMGRPNTRAWLRNDAQGFVLVRAGLRAVQVGPLVAPHEAGAIALLDTAFGALQGPVFLDVPTRWHALTDWLGQRGFARQRPFTRMALGPSAALGGSDRLFVLAGPEFG